MYHISTSPEMGRGLYASRDIERGELVTLCDLLVLSPEDTTKVNETDLKYYTFVYNQKQDCLVLGDGEIFNHDESPNVVYFLQHDGPRLKMHFVATRDITEGEQLFIDYGHDTKVQITGYVNQKSLTGVK